MSRLYLLVLAFSCTACTPSLDENVEQLSGSPKQREKARHKLLLAKERAVEPLLQALEDPQHAAGRAELAEVLTRLMLRVDDPRLEGALLRHLRDDPDAQVRARIAYKLSSHKKIKYTEDDLC